MPLLTKHVRVQNEKKPVSIFESMQIVRIKQTSTKFLEKKMKKIVKNLLWKLSHWLSVILLMCFDLYLINIFVKSTNAERCSDIMFKLTLYCLFVTAGDIVTFRVEHLIFPALPKLTSDANTAVVVLRCLFRYI